jgi:predicted nucleotidyltransferase component of viral defense system
MTKNLAVSVRQRLMNLNRSPGQQQDFQKLLRLYALERLLYRLSQSNYRNDYILKGGLLFVAWMGQPHRGNKYLDLLGYGNNTIQYIKEVFGEIALETVQDDGLVFDQDLIQGTKIHVGQEYEGVQLQIMATLGNARIPFQVEVGFGHIVTPAPIVVEYPTLLDFPAPSLRAYPVQTVIAEKFQALVKLELNNSRMKDFYDLWILGRDFEFEGRTLTQALQATFERRRTQLPINTPLGLTSEFSLAQSKQHEWQSFLIKNKLSPDNNSLSEVITYLKNFLMPVSIAAAGNKEFNKIWSGGGPWKVLEQQYTNSLIEANAQTKHAAKIEQINQLSDKEFLQLRQSVTEYFSSAPPRPPTLADQQLVRIEVDGLFNQINSLWSQHASQTQQINRMRSQPLRAWNEEYELALKQAETTLQEISQRIAQLELHHRQLKEWEKQGLVRSSWEKEPQTIEMREIASVLGLPEIQQRLSNIQHSQPGTHRQRQQGEDEQQGPENQHSSGRGRRR